MKNLFFFFLLLQTMNVTCQTIDCNKVDNFFSEYNKPNVPGCAIGIFKNNGLIYGKGFGLANIENKVPNDLTSLFEIASISKQFTAACIVLLAEKGKLNLDNKLSDFFPDFPDFAHQITIRHLLNHTSGIRNNETLAFLKNPANSEIPSDTAVMRLLANQKELNFKPGEKYQYSNTGYWLLGQIVKKVAQMDLAEFAKQEIFQPLGMNHTFFCKDHSKILNNQALGYSSNQSGGFNVVRNNIDNQIGSKGIYTNIEDFKKWDDAFYKSDLFNNKFWSTMLQCGVLNNGDTIEYACGQIKGNYNGLNTISHSGSYGGYRSHILRFPDQHVTVVILANREDSNPMEFCYNIADLLIKDQVIGQESTLKSFETSYTKGGGLSLELLTGTYVSRPGMNLNISLENDSLTVQQSWNSFSYKIVRTKENTFHVKGDPNMSFIFSDLQNGSTQQLQVFRGERKIDSLRKHGNNTGQIVPEDYVGKYYSQELNVVYEFSVQKHKLYGSTGIIKPMELFAFDSDQFTYGSILIKFKRNDKSITGFELEADGVNNLKFEKMQ